MPVAPDPEEIFERAVDEGQRRLDQSMLELVATSFIAGFTIVFGIAALGVAHAMVPSVLGNLDRILGALVFAIGMIFLIVGRAELFNENFFDPVAKAVDNDDSWMVGSLARLWTVTLLLNLVGGGLFALAFAVEGVLPPGSGEALTVAAEDIVHRSTLAKFASGIVGGALVALLSFMLQGVNSVGSRASMAYAVGFLLAIGPFDHAVVTAIHVLFGLLFGVDFGYVALATTTAVALVGNFVGGLGLVTVTHVAQAVGAEE